MLVNHNLEMTISQDMVGCFLRTTGQMRASFHPGGYVTGYFSKIQRAVHVRSTELQSRGDVFVAKQNIFAEGESKCCTAKKRLVGCILSEG